MRPTSTPDLVARRRVDLRQVRNCSRITNGPDSRAAEIAMANKLIKAGTLAGAGSTPAFERATSSNDPSSKIRRPPREGGLEGQVQHPKTPGE